jgi:hypothetical protein
MSCNIFTFSYKSVWFSCSVCSHTEILAIRTGRGESRHSNNEFPICLSNAIKSRADRFFCAWDCRLNRTWRNDPSRPTTTIKLHHFYHWKLSKTYRRTFCRFSQWSFVRILQRSLKLDTTRTNHFALVDEGKKKRALIILEKLQHPSSISPLSCSHFHPHSFTSHPVTSTLFAEEMSDTKGLTLLIARAIYFIFDKLLNLV